MAAKPIPDGYHSITPYLIVRGAAQAIGFYGDRSGYLEDPFGHTWSIATHQEDLSMEEINTRAEALAKKT